MEVCCTKSESGMLWWKVDFFSNGEKWHSIAQSLSSSYNLKWNEEYHSFAVRWRKENSYWQNTQPCEIFPKAVLLIHFSDTKKPVDNMLGNISHTWCDDKSLNYGRTLYHKEKDNFSYFHFPPVYLFWQGAQWHRTKKCSGVRKKSAMLFKLTRENNTFFGERR